MKKEIKIALVAIIALIVLYFGLNFLKGASMFTENNEYFLNFKNVAGVTKNCAIYADGVVVGEVDNITYDYSHKQPTQIIALLRKKMVVPQGTRAEVKTDLMGNTQINLLLGDYANPPIEPGGTIMGKEDGGVMDQLTDMLPSIEAMLPKLDSILASINLLLADPAMKGILTNTHNLTASLSSTAASLNSLMAKLDHEVPTVIESTNKILTSGDKVMTSLAAADVEGTMTHVSQALAEVETTIAKMNSSDGTIGKLLNDTQLYDNLTATMADADSLVVDLKANPKRYVHFSLFGRKN